MTSRDFCYWLQGAFEITKAKALSEDQVAVIQAHLNLVFKHEIDPSMGDKKLQDELNKIHESSKKSNYEDAKIRC